MNFHVGMGPPYAYQLTYTNQDTDLTQVQSATFEVQRPDGTTASWTATIQSKSTSTIVLIYGIQSADLTMPGYWQIHGKMVLVGGINILTSEPKSVQVYNAYQPGII